MKPYRQSGFQNSGEKIIDRFAEADRLEAGGLNPIGGKLTANDLLFLAPRNSFGGQEDESIFDLKVGLNEIVISLHDRGELLEFQDDPQCTETSNNMEVARIFSNADHFQQKLKEGYRQITVRFQNEHANESTVMGLSG